MKMSNKLYDLLKFLVIVVLPATATLVSVILSLWNILDAETITAIVGTISAVDTFLGALIGISNMNYKKENEDEE